MRIVVLSILLCVAMSCSGYRLANQDNPFRVEGIKSIAVPMFINKSSIPNVAPKFTKEFTSLFASFPEIELYQSENPRADALLIGIIESPRRNREIYDQKSSQLTSSELKPSIGERPEFFVASSIKYKLAIRIILIKNPSWEDVELAKSDLGKLLKSQPKVIINHTFEREGNFTRSIKSTETTDSEGMTNFTKSKNFFEKNLDDMAKSTAQTFKELVLNVF